MTCIRLAQADSSQSSRNLSCPTKKSPSRRMPRALPWRFALAMAVVAIGLMPLQAHAAYSGSGTFTLITSVADITSGGYYVFTGGSSFGATAMGTVNAAICLAATGINTTGGQISNPPATNVWQITGAGSTWYIYSEPISRYIGHSAANNNVGTSAATGAAYQWSFATTVSSAFRIRNLSSTLRVLQYNSGSPRFACYSTVQNPVRLYKMAVSCASYWHALYNTGTPVYSYYLGDKLQYIYEYGINTGTSGWTVEYGLGQSTGGSGWTWRAGTWSRTDGANQVWKNNADEHQFTATGNWYYAGRFTSGSCTWYADQGWEATTGGSLSAGNYFSVSALNNPGSQSATAASQSQINLGWAKDAQSHDVMIVRSTDSSFTAPTGGTTYNSGNTIGGDTVIYRGGATSYSDTGLSAGTTYYYKFYSENWSYYSAGVDANATTPAPTPSIALADNGTQVTAAYVPYSTTAHVLHKFSLAVTTWQATLNTVAFTTAGTYQTADITNLKLRYSTDATLDAGDATLSTITGPAAAGAKSFTSLSQTISSGATGYFFITADIAASPTAGRTISVNAIATTDLTFASGNKSGSTTAGGTQTIITLPTLSTPTATAIGQTTATLGATVSSLGGAAALTARGTVWGTSASPTGNLEPEGGTGSGAFSEARTGFSQGTKIYYRGYATSTAGTGYSSDGSFYTEPGQASGASITQIGPTTMHIAWTAGANASGAIVVMRASSSAVDDPADGTVYTGNAAYGTVALGSSYVVYAGSGTSVDVTGLTAGTTYYVEVFAYAGTVATSGVNQGINYRQTTPTTANAQACPPAPTGTTTTTTNDTSFVASWSAATGATGYKIDVSTSQTFSVSGGTATNLWEDFVNFTPAGGSSDISSSLDSYTHTAGWTGEKVYTDGGLTKLGTSSARGVLITPTVDLSGNGGAAYVLFDSASWTGDGTVLQLYHASDGSTFSQVGSDITLTESMATYSNDITGGTANSKIRFYVANTSSERYYLDNIYVMQPGTAPDYVAGYSNRTVASGTSETVTGLASEKTYYWRVRATGANCDSVNSSTVSVTTVASVPDVTLADNGTPIGAGTVNAGTASHVLSSFKLTVETLATTLNSVQIATAGSYVSADLTNLKLWYSTDGSFGGDTTLSTLSSPGAAGNKTFSSLSKNLAIGDHYFFITADIASGATGGNTLNVAALANTAISVSSGTPTGSASAGGMQTILSVPVLTLPTAVSIGTNTATLGATVSSLGGVAALSSRGTVYNLTGSPVTENALAQGGTTVGAYSHARTPLAMGTKYYYRGYAANSVGTAYSPQGSFYTEPRGPSGWGCYPMSPTSIRVHWSGALSNDGVIVVMRQGAAVANVPVDGTVYTANSVFGTVGTALGSGYVVYAGAASYIDVTGLTTETEYHVYLMAYKGTVATSGYDQGINYRDAEARTTSTLTLHVAPTLNASNLVFSGFLTNGATISWQRGNGDGVVVGVGDNDSDYDVGGAPYADSNWSWGDEIDGGWFCVYNGTGTSVTVSNLSPATTYWAKVWEYSGSGGTENYKTDDEPFESFTTVALEPTTQASGLSFTGVGETAMTVNWTGGNGASNLVVVRAGAAVSWTPTDGVPPAGVNANYGLGTDLGSGNKLCYSGNGASVALTGLDPETTYYVKIFEYNGAGATVNYLTTGTPLSGSQATLTPTCVADAVNILQRATYYTAWGSGGGIFDNSGNTNELGQWANSGDKQSVAWRNFRTHGGGAGNPRELQPGDRFRISVYGYSPNGILGASLNDGAATGSWANRHSNTRGYIQCGNGSGDLYVTYGSGSTAAWGSGIKPWGTTVTLQFDVLSTREFTANVVGQTPKCDLAMMNTPGDTDRIDGYSIYYNDGGSDVWWQPETSVTNLGYVEFGADNGTRTIYGKITDGTNPKCTNASPNYLKKSGSGTITLGNSGSTYTLHTDIAGGTLQIAADGALGTAPGGTSTEHIRLAGGAALVFTDSFTLNAYRGITLVGNNAFLAVADNKVVTYNGVITDGTSSCGWIKNQGGELVLGGASSYDGCTYVDNGTITVSNSSALGPGPIDLGQGSGTPTYGATLKLALDGMTLASTPITIKDNSSGIKTIQAVVNATLSGAIAIDEASDDQFSIDVASGKTLTLSGVMSVNASGGKITKTGAGTVVLANAGNTHAKKIQINAGTVSISASRNLGEDPAGTYANKITLNGGALKATASFTMHANNSTTLGANNGFIEVDTGVTLTYPAAISGSGAFGKTGAGILKLTGANSFSGPVTNSAGTLQIGDNGTAGSLTAGITNNATLIWHRSDDTSYGGVIAGTGTLEKKGAGTLALSAANSYTGATTITEGIIRISNSSALGTTAGNTTVASGAALELNSHMMTVADALVLNGSGPAGKGALTNNAGLQASVSGAITLNSASTIGVQGILNLNGGISGAQALTVAAAGTCNINSVIGNVASISKTGAGTLSLGAGSTHTFSGTATVSAGTMVNNALANTMAASVASGATLMGTGTNGAVSATGTVDPGATAGTAGKLTGSSLTLNAGATLRVDVANVSGTPGAQWDLFNSTGNVTVGGAATIALFGNPTGWDSTAGYSWLVIDGGGTTTGEGSLTVNTNNFTAPTDGGTFSVVKTGVDIYVVYCPRRPAAPVAFDAAAASVSSMALTFTRNAQSDDVIIVYDLDGTFTEPTGAAPAVGAAFAGGTVVYKLGTSPQTHSSLAACTPYYYKVWSYKGTNYSATGLTDNDVTATPAAPATVWASATNETDFTAAWSAATGASGYRLDVSLYETFMTGGSGSTRTNDCADVGGGTISSYLTRIWTNNTDVVWTAYKARIDETVNGDPSVCLKNEAGAYIATPDIPAGLGSLSFDVQQKYSDSGGQVTVFVNGSQVGSPFAYNTSAQTATFNGINVQNVTSLVISNNASARAAINNVVWTDYIPNVPSYVSGYSNLTVAGTSQSVTGLTGGQTYYFRVRTHGAGGCDSINSATTNVLTIAYSTVALADNGTQIAAGTVLPDAAAHVLHRFKLTVGTAAATLTALGVTTTGDYAASDVANLKLWYSADATFNSGTDSAIKTLDNPGAAGAKDFTGLSQNLALGDHYFFVTADIAESPDCGKTIGLAAVTTGGLTIAGATKNGSTTDGGAQTITGPEPTLQASNLAFNNVAGSQMDVSWTSGNGDRRIVVATAYDMAGLWLFDEGSGTTASDSSPNANHGTLYNTPTWTTRTGGGGALSFDNASSEYVQVLNHASLQTTNSQTISFWINPDTFYGRQNPWNKSYGGEGTITLEPATQFNYYWGTAGSDTSPYQGVSSVSGLTAGQWTHVVLVRDLVNNYIRWYFNGSQVASVAPTYASAKASTANLRFGTGYAGALDGSLDEMMLLPYALTATEVANLYGLGSVANGWVPATGWVPTDGVAPSGVNANFASATDQGSHSRIVYDGTGTGFTLTGLNPNTEYRLTVYEYKGSGSCANYLTSGTPESDTQATACLGEPTGLYASLTNLTDFTATWTAVAGAGGYLLDVSTNATFGGSGATELLEEDFATLTASTPPAGWTSSKSTDLAYTSEPYVGAAANSYKFSDTAQSLTSPTFATGATNLQFWAYGNGGSGSTLAVSGLVNSVWTLVSTVNIAQNDATYNVALNSQTTQIKFYFTKTYNVALDDVVVQGSTGDYMPGYAARAVAGTSQSVTGLTWGTTYYFRLRATNASCTGGYSTNGVVTLPTPPPNPTIANATVDGNTLMRLAWTKNGSYNVMIVYKQGSASTAPTQGQAYSAGDTCGGGTVIYKGSAEALDHMVNSGQTHHYAFYSYASGDYYSSGLTDFDSTGTFAANETVDTFSYTNGTTLASHGNGSNNWAGAWAGQTTLFTVSNGSFSAQLNYPEPTGNKLFTSPGGGSVNAVNRTNSAWFQSVVYASYIMNHKWSGDNKWCGAYLMDNNTARIFFGESGGGDQRLGLFTTTHATKQILAGDNNDYIVIIKYDISNDDAWASVYKIGTDTVPTTEPSSWDMEYLNVHGGTGKWINGIRLESGGTGTDTPGDTYFDEVRMGSSWGAVVITDSSPPVLPGTGPYANNAFMAVAAGGQFIAPAGGEGTNVFYRVPDNMFGAIGTSGRSGNLQNPGFDGSASGWSKTTGNNIAEWNAVAGDLAGGSAGGILINAWDDSTGAFGEYLQDVAATSGAQVAFSALMRQDTDYTTTFFGLKMQFVDANGYLLNISGANDGAQMMKSTTGVNTTTQRISVAATAPSGTDRVRLLIMMQGPPGPGSGGSQTVLANGAFDGALGSTISGWTRQSDSPSLAWGDGNAGANAGGSGAGIKFDAHEDNKSGGFYQDVDCEEGNSVTFQARMVQNGTWSTTFFGTRLQFLDSGNNVIGGTTYSSTKGVGTQSDFIPVTATAPPGAKKARCIIRMEGSPSGSDRFGYADDASVSGATTAGGGVSHFGYVDNCQLTGAGEEGTGESTLTLVFAGYDPESGLSRGTTDSGTQCNVDVTNVLHQWMHNDAGGYNESRSSTYPNTKSSSASNAWHWTLAGADFVSLLTENFCNTNLGNVYDESGTIVATNYLYMSDGREMASNRVTLSLANAVGGASRGWVTNHQYGYLAIVDDDVQPPSPTLLYVGTNVLNDTYGEANLKITITDEEMSGGGVDFAYSWYDPSGLFLTNLNKASNVFEMIGNTMANVSPNFDLTNATYGSLNYDAWHDPALILGTNGAQVVTCRVVNLDIPGLTKAKIPLHEDWTLTVSAQDADDDRGSFPNVADVSKTDPHVSQDRAVAINVPLTFTIRDDDTNAPTVSASGLATKTDHQMRAGNWTLNVAARDNGSGLAKGDGTPTSSTDLSPYVSLYSPVAYPVLLQELFDNYATITNGVSGKGHDFPLTVQVPSVPYENVVLGVHTVAVTVADYDDDRYNDTLTYSIDRSIALNSNAAAFTVSDDDALEPEILELTVDGVGGSGTSNLLTGSIAVIGVNGHSAYDHTWTNLTHESFSFVVLAPFPAGTTLWFTDCGWDAHSNTNWWDTNEFHLASWTATGPGDVGFVQTLPLPDINGGGDQVALYQYIGSGDPKTDPTNCTFIYAINIDGTGGSYPGWYAGVPPPPGPGDNEYSGLYRGLTEGWSAVSVTSTTVNVYYSGGTTGTASWLLQQISNPTNWTTNLTGGVDYDYLSDYIPPFKVTGAGLFDWKIPDISDQQMNDGGYKVTNIVQDTASGLVATDMLCGDGTYAPAPYYILFNTNGAVAVSNDFPTAYANGYNAGLVTNVVTAAGGFYDTITLGTVDFQVVVADTDDDRPGDTLYSTNVLQVRVYDDDPDGPSVAFTNIQGHGSSDYTGTGELLFYDFGTDTGAPNLQPTRAHSAISSVANVSVNNGSITGYAGVDGAAISATSWTNTLPQYWQFAVTLQPGYALDMTRFGFAARSSSTGPTAWSLRSSKDSYASDLAWGALTADGNFHDIAVTPSSSSNSGSITYRLYASNATANAGTWRIDNVYMTGKVYAVSGGSFVATDSDLNTNGVVFWASVQDSYSGVCGLEHPTRYPSWDLVSPLGIASNLLRFGKGPASQGAQALTNMVVTNGFGYNDIVLGIYTARVRVADYDDDRAGDTMYATNEVELTVVDDDDSPPLFSTDIGTYVTFDGKSAGSEGNAVTDGDLVNGLSISNRLYDEKSGVLSTSVQVRIQSPDGWDSGLVDFTTRPNNGGSRTNQFLDAGTTTVFVANYDVELTNVVGGVDGRALGIWTNTFYAQDYDNDRLGDGLATNVSIIMWVKDDDKTGPRMTNVTATGVAKVALIATGFETNDGWKVNNNGNWTQTAFDGDWISTDAYTSTTDGRGPEGIDAGYHGGFNAINDSLQLPALNQPGWLTVWARLSAAGESKWVLERNDSGTWTPLGEQSVLTTNYAMHSWLVDSTANGVQLRLKMTHKATSDGRSIYFDDLVVTPYRPWTNVAIDVAWAPSTDVPTENSGIKEYRVVPASTNNVPPVSSTNGNPLATTNTTFTPTKEVQGTVTGYVFAVDADEDRGPRDRAAGIAIPTIARLDITSPTKVTNLDAANDQVDDPSTQFDLTWTSNGVGPDDPEDADHPTGISGQVSLLSPWQTYKIYYRPWDPTLVPTNISGETYVWQNYVVEGNYSGAEWKSVCNTNVVADLSAVTNYNALAVANSGSIRLCDLDPGEDYVLVIVGVDRAGNESLASPTSWATNDTIKFVVTSAWTVAKSTVYQSFASSNLVTLTNVPASSNATALAWLAAGQKNGTGAVTKVYDLIYWDSPSKFQENTNNQWRLVNNVKSNWFVDDGGLFRGRGSLRFYRASYQDRWRTSRTIGTNVVAQRPLASEEVYAVHNVVLSREQNYVALHGVPYTNTFQAVFGGTNVFPGGTSGFPGSGATLVEFYSPGTNSVTSSQYWLSTQGRWFQMGGGDVTTNQMPADFFTRGFSITLPNPLPERYVATTAFDWNQPGGTTNPIPAMVWSPILQVPTNSYAFAQNIACGWTTGRISSLVYNLVALRLPVAAHPDQMNLVNCGFVPGPKGFGDEIYTWNTATKTTRSGSTIYCDESGTWRYVQGNGEVPDGYFKPNDVIIIVSRNTVGNGSWTWSYYPTNFYNIPTRWMGY